MRFGRQGSGPNLFDLALRLQIGAAPCPSGGDEEGRYGEDYWAGFDLGGHALWGTEGVRTKADGIASQLSRLSDIARG